MARITVKERNDVLKVKEIQITRPIVEDFIKAEQMAEGNTGNYYLACLISRTALFDGKKLPPEEIMKLDISDFFELVQVLNTNLGLTEEQLSQFQNTQDGNSLRS